MPIYARREKQQYSNAPQGLHQGVCVDVIDLGNVKSTWEGQERVSHMIRIVWMLDCEDEKTHKPHIVSQRYTLSLGKKANLCKMLEAWRGKPFTSEELDEFDVENVIGANGQVQVQHNIKDKETYANVVAVVPLGKGMAKMAVPSDYVRYCDRKHRNEIEASANGPYQAEDEDIPF